jgi:hypothetical protein
MRRFAQNRWWSYLLTLSVMLACIATIPSSSYGDSGTDPITLPGGGGAPDPGGDPDGTAGPGRGGPGYGRMVPGGSRHATTAMGDGVSARSVWVWRLHVVLRSLLSRYSR